GMGPGRAAIDDDIIGGGRIKIEAQAQRSINNVRRTYGSGARNDQHERAKNQGESFHSQILKKQHGRVNARSINYEGLLRLLPAVRYSGGTLGNQQGLTESPSAHGCDGSYQSPRSQSAMRPMA